MAQPPHCRTFDALRDDNFRWLWIGQLAFSAAFQMGNFAVAKAGAEANCTVKLTWKREEDRRKKDLDAGEWAIVLR